MVGSALNSVAGATYFREFWEFVVCDCNERASKNAPAKRMVEEEVKGFMF